jgi:hypothetical protein
MKASSARAASVRAGAVKAPVTQRHASAGADGGPAQHSGAHSDGGRGWRYRADSTTSDRSLRRLSWRAGRRAAARQRLQRHRCSISAGVAVRAPLQADQQAPPSAALPISEGARGSSTRAGSQPPVTGELHSAPAQHQGLDPAASQRPLTAAAPPPPTHTPGPACRRRHPGAGRRPPPAERPARPRRGRGGGHRSRLRGVCRQGAPPIPTPSPP